MLKILELQHQDVLRWSRFWAVMVLLVVRHRKFAHFTIFRRFKLSGGKSRFCAKLSKIKALSKMQFATSQTGVSFSV